MSKRWQKRYKKGGGRHHACFHCAMLTNSSNSPHLSPYSSTPYSGQKKALFFEWNLWYHTEAASIQLLNHLCSRKKKIIWMTSWPLFFQNHRFHFDIGLWTRCASIRSVLSNCSKELAVEFFWYFVYLLVIQRWDVIKSKRGQYFNGFTS